jgi:predicted glycoside hydrolase/deacetylase ChbG (UPF0249 family)
MATSRFHTPHSDLFKARDENLNGRGSGLLIVNADDWGSDSSTTDRTLECVERGAVSSVSAMVFMEDSERAAAIARDRSIDAGLHLNLTTPFTGPLVPAPLAQHQGEISRYLRRNRYAQVVFHPWLVHAFRYSIAAQLAQFSELYGREPDRIDGHHHMHLCANVVLGRLLPAGTVVRRNFSFEPGEKHFANRLYRKTQDWALARRHRMVDFFFSLPPLEPPDRLRRIFSMANQYVVEVETHPANTKEYLFLAGGEIFNWLEDVSIASEYKTPTNDVR